MNRLPGDYAQALAGKSIALLFEKPSLRTRLAFEVAMKQMGSGSVSAMKSLEPELGRLIEATPPWVEVPLKR